METVKVRSNMHSNTGYILGISRGHNSGVCLLKDGEIVFALEEERLSRLKYDGAPYACMVKVLEYTDKVDYIVVSHTSTIELTGGICDFSHDDVYTGLARKLGLIDRHANRFEHPQIIDLGRYHHKIHAACAFYRSGFDDAVSVVVDGAGSLMDATLYEEDYTLWEVESIFDCAYPSQLKTLYKHMGCRDGAPFSDMNMDGQCINEEGTFNLVVSDRAGIVKVYEAVTEYCGFNAIEAGKTMGLFPYGQENKNIPSLFTDLNGTGTHRLSDRNITIPTYPNGAFINSGIVNELHPSSTDSDLTKLKNRRDLAYAVQTQSQDELLRLIIKASEMTEKQNVVLSGGYGLNCVANYYYLNKLNELGINLYVEPISSDAGTAIGAALLFYHETFKSNMKRPRQIYLGPKYNYTENDINTLVKKYDAEVTEATDTDIVNLMTSKNIVAFYQGQSEAGPRALGNRSLLFDPTFKDGKDFVNHVKRREYFRPFAGSILEEDVHEWFDLRGMDSSPHMMYAVNCQPGIEDRIPSIIHVDGTCRIQTVNESENPLYYRLIKAFKEQTGVPVVFNTSFNLGGEPLVESLDDALRTLHESDIEFLYLPEYSKLISVKNK